MLEASREIVSVISVVTAVYEESKDPFPKCPKSLLSCNRLFNRAAVVQLAIVAPPSVRSFANTSCKMTIPEIYNRLQRVSRYDLGNSDFE